MIHTTSQTQKLFNVDFDDFGDSYIEDSTPDRLKEVFSKITQVYIPFPTYRCIFTHLQQVTFENIMAIEEMAHNVHF